MESTLTYRSASELNTAMSRVYGHMAMAVITSMIISYFVGTTPTLTEFFLTGIMKWIVIFSPLLAIFGVSIVLNSNPPVGVAVGMLHGFAALMGLSLATVFVVFTMGSVWTAFMSAAILFAIMSGWGYFTKQDLSGWGKILFIAVIAILISSIINIFLGSTVFQMIISAIAVLVFAALTAYDTQQIREELMVQSDNIAEIRGALSLYLDFINIFTSLLQLFGERKE